MRRFNSRLISIALSICLGIGTISGVAFNSAAEELTEDEEIIEQTLNYREDIDDAFDPQPVDRRLLPNTYSIGGEELTSYVSPYYTSIKNQNPYGTCWAHAICSVAEANVVKKFSVNEPDFSEWQIAYFIGGTYVQDPMGNTKGDSFLSGTDTDDYLEVGGNQKIASIRLASWVGVVDEQDAPYSTLKADKTATIDESVAYSKNKYILAGCDYIPYSDIDTVKKAIYENGAVTASYRHIADYYSTSNYWGTAEPIAEFCPSTVSTKTNHAVTVIGWDDNYSKENFTGSYMPEHDGAWICKNSWGSMFSKNGIFYISYEDGPLSSGEAYSYKYVTADEYDHNYHYDGGVASTYTTRSGEANIYTATSKQQLKGVGYFTHTANYGATISVYRDCEDDNPASGELVATASDIAYCAGYHTVNLDEMVSLDEGQKFSVAIEYSNLSGGSTYIVGDVSKVGTWYESVAEAHTGESFTSKGTTWTTFKSNDGTLLNTRIRALTIDDTSSPVKPDDPKDPEDPKNPEDPKILVDSISLDKNSSSLYIGEKVKVNASVLPADASNKKLKWASANEAVATVDEAGNVVAVSEGETTIVCSSTDGSKVSSICKVVVNQSISACDIKLSDTVFVYSGKAIMPTITVTCGGKTLVKDTDYTVTYSNNVNVGTATVVIAGKGYYTGSVKKSFTISPAKTKLNKLLNEKSDIKLTWTAVTGATGYKLYRSDNGGEYKLISSISNGATVSYKDKAALNNGKLYKYKIVATNGALVGEASDELSIYRVAPVEIVSLKSKSSKAMTIKWKKSTAATKYVIQYSTNSKMTNAKTVTVNGSKNISKTIKKLKKGKKYYVRVKVRKTVGGKNYDSAWSAVKSVKVK